MAAVSLAASLASHGAEVVETTFATRDVVVAESVLGPSAAEADFAPVLQKTVDEVAKLGGGVVFLRAGRYKFSAPVTVRRGVTVRGDYSAARPSAGTVIEIVGGRGEEEGPAAFSLENGAGLVGLSFYYPDQKLPDPVAYPWTVRTALEGRAGNNQTVMDCTFVNSWQALRIGPESNECHTFRRLGICALKTGFLVDMTTDIGRITDVVVSPEVWAKSGFPGAPAKQKVEEFLKSSGATGAAYRRSDWEFVRGLKVKGYATGIRFEKAKVPTNAVIAGSEITDCLVALQLDDLNWVGLACYDSVFAGTEMTVRCAEEFRSTVMFNACTLRGASAAVSAKGTLSFSRCEVGSQLDASSGGRIERVLGDKPAPKAGRIRAEFPEWDEVFKSGRVLFASDFGVSRDSADNTDALQKALDEAERVKGGATVYVGAGYYRFAGTLKVPSGVELRGSSDVPHHTQNGGTVLLATAGRGDEGGEPFLSLAEGSGARGLSVWYPEQPISEPVAYPWTIRSLGPKCWLRDVNLGNSWQGVDFATNPSDGHAISYVSGGFFKTGVLVGNTSGRAWVEDLQFNPHYMLRLSHRLPVNWGPKKESRGEHPSYPFCRRLLRGIILRDCADEKVTGTFLYAARDGLSIEGRTKADVLIHGTDTGCRGIRLSLGAGSSVRTALAQLVPLGADEEAAIVADAQNAGEAEFYATQIWPKNPVLVNAGDGKIVLDQYNACGGGGVEGKTKSVSSLLGHVSR